MLCHASSTKTWPPNIPAQNALSALKSAASNTTTLRTNSTTPMLRASIDDARSSAGRGVRTPVKGTHDSRHVRSTASRPSLVGNGGWMVGQGPGGLANPFPMRTRLLPSDAAAVDAALGRGKETPQYCSGQPDQRDGTGRQVDVAAGHSPERHHLDELDEGQASYGSEGWGFESLRAHWWQASDLRKHDLPVSGRDHVRAGSSIWCSLVLSRFLTHFLTHTIRMPLSLGRTAAPCTRLVEATWPRLRTERDQRRARKGSW